MAKQPLTAAEINRLSGGDPVSLIDRKKPSFRALGLGDKPFTAVDAIKLMQANPSIIRRPIFEIDGRVVIAPKEADLAAKLGKG